MQKSLQALRLRVFYPDNTSFLLPEEQELVDAIAGDVERWLKEITCVYEIRRTAELELPLEDVCQQILKLIIPALQFPQLATVMIELDDKRFVSELQEHGHTHELHSKITADNMASEQGTMHELQSNIAGEQPALRSLAGTLSSRYRISAAGRAGAHRRNRGRLPAMAQGS
jgi:hypothetical protein